MSDNSTDSKPAVAQERNVNASARAEIDNAQSLEAALDAHDFKWRDERRKIAAASDPFPDFDLGSRAQRNILSEYEERRWAWEMERDSIEEYFYARRATIRETLQTLAGEFTAQSRDGQSADARVFSFTATKPQAPGVRHDDKTRNAGEAEPNSAECQAQSPPGEREFIVPEQTQDRGKTL